MNKRSGHAAIFGLFMAIFAFSCSHQEENKADKATTGEVKMKMLPEENSYAPLDISPMDVSYFPPGYPLLKMKDKNIALPTARIIYSRPKKKGRPIFGTENNNLCPFGKPWRLGANEASEIEFFRDVFIKGKEVKAGKYVIYCIPYENKWNLRLNTGIYSWGLQFDSTADILSVEEPVLRTNKSTEEFTMVFLPSPEGASLLMAWDSVEVKLPVSFKPQ